MKEDVLEQIVDDYLKHEGFFTKHNVKFRPDVAHLEYDHRLDSGRSDIDVLAINPKIRKSSKNVWAVSCKSWQKGFNAQSILRDLEILNPNARRQNWQGYRELVKPKWSKAFIDAVKANTGQDEFTYVIAATKLIGPWAKEEAEVQWANNATIAKALDGRPLKFLTLTDMWSAIADSATSTPEASDIGRIIQLLRAANIVG